MRALVFDFDGLILDTESASHDAWVEIYRLAGLEFPRELWLSSIGSDGSSFDPSRYLEEQADSTIDRAELREWRRARHLEVLEGLRPLPGVTGYLEQARDRGMGIAVASSSPRAWVQEHLDRFDLTRFFDALVCEDDVDRVKPHPELYELAVTKLSVEPVEAIALEDSPNGIAAATSAGLFCVAVPNPITRALPMDEAHLVLESLEHISLEQLIDRASPRKT